MIQISISEEIIKACPDLQIVALSCQLKNTQSDDNLWKQIALIKERIRAELQIEEINKWPPIFATRQAYKRLGKDPNRYRPSSEALCRRILRGLPLYQIDTLVDIVNLVSIQSGFSIGGFDLDKIEGNQLVLGVGHEGEIYRGIGRGELNIEGLPVYRDKKGGVGTPTSDEERTKIDIDTTHFLMIINGYSGKDGLLEAAQYSIELLEKYVSAKDIEVELIVSEGKTILSFS